MAGQLQLKRKTRGITWQSPVQASPVIDDHRDELLPGRVVQPYPVPAVLRVLAGEEGLQPQRSNASQYTIII